VDEYEFVISKNVAEATGLEVDDPGVGGMHCEEGHSKKIYNIVPRYRVTIDNLRKRKR
jgi:hypothetical protein